MNNTEEAIKYLTNRIADSHLKILDFGSKLTSQNPIDILDDSDRVFYHAAVVQVYSRVLSRLEGGAEIPALISEVQGKINSMAKNGRSSTSVTSTLRQTSLLEANSDILDVLQAYGK